MSAATSSESLVGLSKHLARPASRALQASLLGTGRKARKTYRQTNAVKVRCSLQTLFQYANKLPKFGYMPDNP